MGWGDSVCFQNDHRVKQRKQRVLNVLCRTRPHSIGQSEEHGKTHAPNEKNRKVEFAYGMGDVRVNVC